MKRVAYRYGSSALAVEGGAEFRFDDSGEGFIGAISDARDVGLTALRDALSRYARDYGSERSHLVVVDMPASRIGDGLLIDPIEVIWDRGVMRVSSDAAFDNDAPAEDEILARVAGVVAARGAGEATANCYFDVDQCIVTIEVPLRTRGLTVGSAIDLARNARARILTPIEDLGPAGAAEIILAGQSSLLVGSYESEWLEVKRAPYRDLPEEQLELAKDVASFANRGGGLLLIGLKSKADTQGDRITAVNECRLDDGSVKLYRRTIEKHIYPRIEDVNVAAVPGASSNQGIMMIEIPRQAEGKKPFLVHGVLVGDRVAGAYFGLPTRRGDDTEYLDIRVVHSYLRAGQSYLERIHESSGTPATGGLTAIEERLDALEEMNVPEFLRRVVSAARKRGFTIEHGPASVAFRHGSGNPVVVSSSSSGPLVDQAVRESLLEQLSLQGLPVERTKKGFLRPKQ